MKQVKTLYGNHSNLPGRLLPKGSSDALVLIKISYKLTSDFYALNTNAELYIYPRSKKLKDLTPDQEGMDDSHVPFFMKKVSLSFHLPEDNTRNQNLAAKQWTRNQGELIIQAMDKTIEGVAGELLDGLRHPYR